MRLFFHKISLIISGILSVILISIPTTPVVDNMNNNIKDNNAIQEKVINENEIIKSDQEELQVEEKEIKEVVEEKKPIIENKKSTTSTTSTQNNTKQANNNIQIDTTSSTSNNNVEVHEEVPKQEIKQETNNVNQYIGVPNPNDFYYSFHHGKIEYSSMDSCLADVPRISFKDTIDIINAWCIDVVDGQGTILGQYLYINCSSGNCDKYK